MSRKQHNEGIIVSGGSVTAGQIAVGKKAKAVYSQSGKISKYSDKTKRDIFLSYASEQFNVAEQLALTLSNSGHNVFFDRRDIPTGDDFNVVIRNKIKESDLFVFLISPSSVADGSYTRSELKLAQGVWKAPEKHVLPVMAVPTPLEIVPNYLKSVNILYVEGNLASEVAAKIDEKQVGSGKAGDDFVD